jgi:hypothetical protein
VTHDPRYARHAERHIHLFDGRVVSEAEARNLELAAETVPLRPAPLASGNPSPEPGPRDF